MRGRLPVGRLVDRVPDVTALDVDADVLRRAEHRFADTSIWWVHGDVMTASYRIAASTRCSPARRCTTSRAPVGH
ncbi:putative methyltransferase/methylase [Mycobacterium ulcerans str. Harvey]|uniref:Methyltransferase/methylase n=1 Tax=Mycobacterium ulcerans str. Harvey TaxID=1299332 RepID=A0ABN0QTJ8_MYCUL|nr:putative methyltransferase/methylase [Mycobacterium ulcerans str. Harvey]